MGLPRFIPLIKSLKYKPIASFPNPTNPFFLKNHHNNPSFLYQTQFISSNKSLHTTQPSHSNTTTDTTKDQTLDDTNTLCKILSTHNTNTTNISHLLNHSNITTLSPQLTEHVLKHLSNAGPLALTFFRWAENKPGFKHTTESYNALIESLGKIKQFRVIWSLVEEMKAKGLFKKDTFTLIMRRYAKARKTKEVLETFNKMETYGMILEGVDYNKLIDILSKCRFVRVAHKVFDEMKKRKFEPDIKTYTILLEGWGDEKNILMVEEVLREMKDEGFEPDVVTYGIVINAYCKSMKYEEALRVVREMEVKKVELSPHVYCTLVNALGGAGRLDEAIEFFNKSKASGFASEIPTYNALVGAYCWSSRFEDAGRVMEEMKLCGVGPNARTCEIVLHHLIRTRRTTNAYSVFQKIESDLDCQPTLNTYGMIMKMFCDDKRVNMAVEVWNKMKSKGILPSMHIFSSLIAGLCGDNKLDDACKYFEEMLDVGLRPPGQVYGKLKEALIEAGKKDVVISLDLKLDRARKTPLVE